MGNAQVVSKRIGWRENRDSAEIQFSDDDQLDPNDGIEPKQLVMRMEIDKIFSTGSVRFVWIAKETVAAPPNTKIATADVPVTMETLTTSCSLPRPWPEGVYEVRVFSGSDLLGTKEFRIATRKPEIEKVTLMYGGDKKHVSDEKVISPNAGKLFVEFKAKHAVFSKEQSFFQWIAVNCEGSLMFIHYCSLFLFSIGAPENFNIADKVVIPPGR